MKNLEAKQITKIATTIIEARDNKKKFPSIIKAYPSLNFDDAYAVQHEIVRINKEQGVATIGYKVGMSNPSVMKNLNLKEPLFAYLLQYHFFDYQKILLDFFNSKVELEIAFVISKEINSGTKVTLDNLFDYVTGYHLGFEVVEDRCQDSQGVLDVLCDNINCGAIVLHPKLHKDFNIDFSTITADIFLNNEQVAAGESKLVYGSPVKALLWLIVSLQKRGMVINQDDIIMTGSFMAMIEGKKGDYFRASVSNNLGEIELTI